MNDKTTHFGYKTVNEKDKADRVARVFSSVANRYDLMNDFMSLGIHRLWKHSAINHLSLRAGHQVLDLAGGTGDLTRAISQQIGDGHVICADINAAMLAAGRARLLDQGVFANVSFKQADAEALPFANNHFHRCIMGFGLRNVTNKDQALNEIYRVLKPGGLCLILEFSTPTDALLKTVYDAYSFNVIPKIGGFIANDEASYQYLVESIRMHPDQATLLAMLQAAGFEDARYHNLTGGIVAIHKGYKY